MRRSLVEPMGVSCCSGSNPSAEADGKRTRLRALVRTPVLKACPTLAERKGGSHPWLLQLTSHRGCESALSRARGYERKALAAEPAAY